MSEVPSIKGSVFSLAVEDLLKLVASGQIGRAELAAKLGEGDAVYLDQPLRASGWYDIAAYGRMLELLKDLEGGGSDEYLCARGARSATVLLERGTYQQLDYLKRMQLKTASGPEERFRAFGRDLRLLVTLSDTIYNFGKRRTEVDPDYPDRHVSVFAEAEALPDSCCWTGVGFRNRMAEEYDAPGLWRFERPRPDLVLFRMTRAI